MSVVPQDVGPLGRNYFGRLHVTYTIIINAPKRKSLCAVVLHSRGILLLLLF